MNRRSFMKRAGAVLVAAPLVGSLVSKASGTFRWPTDKELKRMCNTVPTKTPYIDYLTPYTNYLRGLIEYAKLCGKPEFEVELYQIAYITCPIDFWSELRKELAEKALWYLPMSAPISLDGFTVYPCHFEEPIDFWVIGHDNEAFSFMRVERKYWEKRISERRLTTK